MRSEVGHEEAFAELDAVAFDLLDTVERDAIMLHVATCSACRAELDALQETVAELAFAAPAAGSKLTSSSRGQIRERLLARTGAGGQSNGQTKPTPLVFPRPIAPPPVATVAARRRVTWMAIAAGVLFVASLGMFARSFGGRDDVVAALKQQVAASELMRHTKDSLVDQLAARDSLIAGIAGRDVTVLTLTSAAAKDPYARMFWDRARHTWTMIAHNMPALRAGRTYQLWLVTPKSKISAGTFTVHNGDAVVRATFDLTDSLQGIAVTDEPAGGVPQPTGSVVVAAATK